MHFIQQRYSDDGDSTLSLLFKVVPMGNSENKLHWFLDTLEDEFREDKLAKETRIPAGIYKLKIRKEETPLTLKYRKRYSWFKFFIEILNVPNFKYIYLHAGITDDWTDGCVLTAMNRTRSNGKQSLVEPEAGMKKFYDAVYDYLEKGNEVTYEIRDESHLLK